MSNFIGLIAGRLKEVAGLVTSAGAGDAGKIPALDGAGKLSSTLMPTGLGSDSKSLVTSENIAAGDFVNIYDVTGTATLRKADATAEGKEAVGFVTAGSTSGGNNTVYFEGEATGQTGLTAGLRYYLDTTAGGETVTPPSPAGNVVQLLGIATSTTEIAFEASDTITVA